MENLSIALSISCVLLFEVGWGDIYPVSEGLTLTEVSFFLNFKRGYEGLERVDKLIRRGRGVDVTISE